MTNLITISLDTSRTIYLGKTVCYPSAHYHDYVCKRGIYEISVFNISYDLYRGDYEYAEVVDSLYSNKINLDYGI